MRLWSGKGEDEPPLPELAFLTGPQATRVRNLFRQSMAERGCELTTDSLGNFRDDEGNYYGLWNIAVLCRNDPGGEKGWPGLIAGYADTLLKGNSRAARAEVAALTPDQARGLVYLSVRSAASLGNSAAGFRSAPELAPGLLQLLALDMSHTTVPLDDGEVARLGGQESLREAALANLRALPLPAHQRIGGPEAHFEALIDDSHFTASRALAMPDLLSRVLGASAPHGVLVALPARHYLFVHVLADKTAAPSLLKLATMARVTYRREQGPISPDVLWWRDGDWIPVPSVVSDGNRVLRPGPELSFLLTDLATQSPRA
jgi:hypothetical protein